MCKVQKSLIITIVQELFFFACALAVIFIVVDEKNSSFLLGFIFFQKLVFSENVELLLNGHQ